MLINALIPGLLIAIVTMLGNYAANRKQIKHDNLRAAKKEAYEAFFLPFISLMYSESRLFVLLIAVLLSVRVF